MAIVDSMYGVVRPGSVKTYGKDEFSFEYLRGLRNSAKTEGRKHTASVIIPAKNAERTIANIVKSIVDDLVAVWGIVDEVIVLDHDSTDSTAKVAAEAGATVFTYSHTQPIQEAVEAGKGSVMRKGVHVASGDFVVFCDADHTRFDSFKVARLLGPLLLDDSVQLVKAFYRGYGGGRSTEAMARPVISLLHPQLAALEQPLTGEQAGRRSMFTKIRFPHGWGTEYRILEQVNGMFGAGGIAQVDVEYKEHESGDSRHINRQAFELLHAAMRARFGEDSDIVKTFGSVALCPGDEPGSVMELPTRTVEWPPLG